uniref:SUN domain-containing protein n=1 Tax=Schistosoma mansoni TaxID=6183 RepID=A0A5K4F1Q0_SCHMA
MDKTKRKTFMFIPSELTELTLLRNQKSKFSNTTDFYSLGYKIPEIYGSQSNNIEVVLILGFYDSFSKKNEVCPYCCVKIQSDENLHVCAQSLKKYKFDRSCIETYYPLLTNESYIWISLDMNKLPSLLKHGILMKYSRLFSSQKNTCCYDNQLFESSNRWLYSMMKYEIGQSLCTLILWSNQFTPDYTIPCYNQCNYEKKSARQHSHFIEIIKQIFTKLFHKTIEMSYTLLLIKYQYDTSKKSSIFCTNCLNKLSSTTTNTNTTSTDTTTTDNSSNIITTDHSSMLHIHHSNMLSLSTFIPDPSLILFCAVQLLILMLCFMTVPHRHHHHRHMVNHYNSDCCTPNTNKLSQLFSCSPIQSNYNTVTTTTTTTTTNMVISSWLPNDLNCKIIPTLGLFYLDKNEENYTLTLSSKNLTSSSPWILYNSTKELVNYLSPSTNYCQMNILYRYIEYFTCELTRLLLWLEQGKPAGLKINIHLSYLMGQFFLYHLLAWRSYVTFIIQLLIYLINQLNPIATIHSINNHNHNNNYYYIINMITIICLLMSTIYIMATISIYQYKQYYPHYYHYHYHYYYYYIIFIFKLFLMCFSLIIRLMFSLLLCLLLDTIELITLHLTSFYIYATHLLRLQLKTIAASWRLCRNSSKWNPLRNRVDKIPDMYVDSNEFFLSVNSLQKKISLSSSSSSPTLLSTSTTPEFVNDTNQYQRHQSERSIMGQKNILYKFISHKKDSDIILCDQLTKQTCGLYLDRLLVSTLLGLAIGLCLFTTTIAFYITFTSVQLILLLIKNILKSLIWFIMDFPLESLVCWLLNSSNYQTKLVLETPRIDSKYFPFLQLKVTRIDFNEMYQQNHLLHKPIFPSKSLSFMNIFYCLLSAQDIR